MTSNFDAAAVTLRRKGVAIPRGALVVGAAVLFALGAGALVRSVRTASSTSDALPQAPASAYVRLAPSFTPNAGQLEARQVRYEAQGTGYAFAFTRKQMLLSFAKQGRDAALALRFVEPSHGVRLVPSARLPGAVNYLVGRDPTKWRTGLPRYGELVYRGVWPGIDVHVRGEPGRLKYEFHLKAGADPSMIRLAYRGARGLSLTRSGALALATPLGTIRDARPLSYQLVGGKRRLIPSAYRLSGASYGFAVGRYDRSRALVIDPGLEYSTYLGGSSDENGSGIAVEGGYAYVSGCTTSTDFPTTAGAVQRSYAGGDLDAFVTKLTKDGSGLVYSTFLGGGDVDCVGNGIAVEGGRAYITGATFSPDYPTTPGAFQRTYAGGDGDAFVSELSPDGSSLVYSTYLGGATGSEAAEQGNDIAVEGGRAYVTGITDSTDFPTTASASQRTKAAGLDVFASEITRDGSALVYSTYLGGSDDEESDGIAVEAGHAYITGFTQSSDFPATPGALQTAISGSSDGFVTKLASDGSSLDYSTFLGGTNRDNGHGIAVEGGDAYVVGTTRSTDFPTTPGVFQRTYGGGNKDAYIAKLDRRGASLVYSTYLGGGSSQEDFAPGVEDGLSIAVEGGRASVTGDTHSTDFPTTPNAVQRASGGFFDAFVAVLGRDASTLDYSTYLGGPDFDQGTWIAVEGQNAYVTGGAGSGFPVTPGRRRERETARQGAFRQAFGGGSSDAFVTKVDTK